ncbi:MAG: DUF3850 domain-containing protein [Gammaproteobacteria bacterium]|nr:DUF3850 domain-containing protein [Gammaproteobacteria bacterium]
MPIVHKLKTWSDEWDAVSRRDKRFEFRRNDRDFKVGDVLRLQRWNPVLGEYTGALDILVPVTYVLHGNHHHAFGVPEGYCVMSLDCNFEQVARTD